MSITTSVTSNHLHRSNLWSAQLKDILQDELDAQKWVDWLSEFPDGDTFNIPSIGEASVQDVQENQDLTYESLDTGNFTFTITEYKGSAHAITRKALQDAFYAQKVLSAFVPKEARAIMEVLESDILRAPSPVNSQGGGGQTVNAVNAVNGANHRFGGSGGSAAIAVSDFSYAKYALKKANVPLSNLVAIVDPSVAFVLENATNLVNISNNPRYEGIVNTGLTTGMRFIKNVYGFDVYESNYLDNTADATVVQYDGSTAAVPATTQVQNLFFSAAPAVLPIMGAWRQMPMVDSEFNKDKQREEYVTTCRYGIKMFRPENMVCVLTEATVS